MRPLGAGTSVLIIGCGYAGRRIGRRLIERGCAVRGTTRSSVSAESLSRDGIEPLLCDLRTAEGFASFGSPDYAVLSAAPAGRDMGAYQELFVDGFSRLLTYLHFHPPREGLLYTSSVGVYAVNDGSAVDEAAPLGPSETPRVQALRAAESIVRDSGVPSIVYRLGGIYGPGRNRLRARSENILPVDEPGKFINMIHVDDVSHSVEHLLERSDFEETYIGVDDEPIEQGRFVAWLQGGPDQNPASAAAGSAAPRNKRCSNRKLKAAGYRFLYPTFREGYQRLFQDEPTETGRGGHEKRSTSKE